MKPRHLLLIAAAFAVAFSSAPSDALAKRGGVGKNLFPPDMVLRFHKQLGITAAQERTLKAAMQTMNKTAVDLKFQIARTSTELGTLLAANRVNEARALALATKVMSLEGQLKKAHLTLLIRIKNTLTAAQISKLKRLRAEARKKRRAMPGGRAKMRRR